MSKSRVSRRTTAVAVLAAVVALALALGPAVGAASVTDGGLEEPLENATNDSGEAVDVTDTDDGTVTNDSTETDASLETDDETDASATADASLGADTENDSVGVDGDATVEAGDETVLEGDLGTDVDEDGVSVSADAESDAGVTASANGSVDDLGGVDDTLEGVSNGSVLTGSDARDAGGGGASGAIPGPDGAGEGLAAGSLLVGAGLLGRRALETTVATGGAGGSGGGSLLAAAWTWVRTWGWRLAALLGYSRYDDADPLEHETRAAIYEQIEDDPGVFLTELSEAVDVPTSTLRYHLRILEHENLIASRTVNGKRRYASVGVDPDELDVALDDDATATVLEAVAHEPDSVSGLADRLDLDPSTVTHHLQRLDEADLVERERDGRSVVSRLADGVDRGSIAPGAASPAD